MKTNNEKKQTPARTDDADQLAGISVNTIGKFAERTAFAKWLFDPNRTPRSQKEFAKLIGVSEATLSDWKKTAPEVLAAAKEFKDSPYILVGFAEATRRMAEEAKRGKVNAYRALADVLGEMAPQKVEYGTLADFLRGDAPLESVRPYAVMPGTTSLSATIKN